MMECHAMLYGDNFADMTANVLQDFPQHYRMNKELFMKLFHVAREYYTYFVVKKKTSTDSPVSHQFRNALLL
jgi:hypothetical protein